MSGVVLKSKELSVMSSSAQLLVVDVVDKQIEKMGAP